MQYELDMNTGQKTRPIIEVGDRFYFEIAGECGTVIAINKDSYAYTTYTLEMKDGTKINLLRSSLLRDGCYVGNSETQDVKC